jgi:selenocysteine lyase/cysteine desulfurase
VVVDGAATTAHRPIHVSGNENPERDLDVVIFSGHKVYAPGSPGVVVTRKDLFAGQEPQEVGGGMVGDVYINRYTIMEECPEREEAGTPNIVGALGLAASLYALDRVGMDTVAEHECEIIEYALKKLSEIEGVTIYGETDPEICERAGAVSFNIKDMEHGLTGAALNDYFNISVRNECFCAHPYVREMISEALAEEDEDLTDEELENMADLQRGMVRASFGIYSRRSDVDALANAVREMAANKAFYKDKYNRLPNTDYVHKTFKFDHESLFSVRGAVDDWLAS